MDKFHVGLAFAAAGFVGVSSAQTAAAPETLQRVEITGSNIKRIDAETSSPVEVIKREEIQRTGVNSVKQLLDTLTSASSSLSDIGGSNSFASGASGAALRNLGKESTLILLNSRRVAPYALADYSEVFTNLDSLPIDAVERIEILKNGGSAVYGSDAVAGVINIITRSDYRGLQVKVSQDQSIRSSQFKEKTASLTGGFGDLQKDNYNVLANIEFFKRSSVIWRDVLDEINPEYGETFATLRNGSGGKFGNRGAPSTYSYPGNIDGVRPVAGCSTFNSGGLCVYDRFTRFEAQPAAERTNVLVSGKVNLTPTLQSFSEVLYSTTKTDYISAFQTYGLNADVIWGDPATGLPKKFAYRGLPVGHPLNPNDDSSAELRYRFVDSDGTSEAKSSQYRFLTGLKGSFSKYDWETAIGVMGSETKDRSRGNFSESGFKQVIGDYTVEDGDPQFFNRGYRIGQVNSEAVLNTLFPQYGSDGKTRQIFLDGKVSGDIGQFQGRPIGMALGFDVRRETFRVTPTDNLKRGDIVGFGLASADASRTHSSIFTEFNLPVTQRLELQAAGRVDKFPGFNAHVSPKVGARFEVAKELLLRSTVETGFRAPNLTESAPSTKFAFSNGVFDPKRCNQAQQFASALSAEADALPDTDPNKARLLAQADTVQGNECAAGVASIVKNNPDLKPEESRSISLGFVFEPSKEFDLSVDYWNIKRRNEIGVKSTQDLLAAENSLPPGVVLRGDVANDPTFTTPELRNTYGVTDGALTAINGMFENTAKTKVSGLDIGATRRFGTDVGKVELTATGTYLIELRTWSPTLNGGAYGDNLVGRYGHSRLVANFGAALDTGHWSHAFRWTYNSPTKLQDDYYDTEYTPEGCADKGWDRCTVGSYNRLDYNLSYTGIKNTTISMFVRNLLGERPPIDLRSLNSDGGGVIPQSIEDVRGRMLRLTLEYKFF